MTRRRSAFSAVTSPAGIRFAVLAAVALVVSLAGSAAATALITGSRIKDGTVTGRDLHGHTITAADIRDGALTARDFSGGRVTGPTGLQGTVGPAGPVGPHGRSGLEYAVRTVSIDPDSYLTTEVRCASPGKVAIAGGETSDRPENTRLEDSAPSDDHAGWVITARNKNLFVPLTVQAIVVCANAR
jgi:hypothetical protein